MRSLPQLLSFAFPLGIAGTFGFSYDRRTSVDYLFRTKGTVNFPGGEFYALDTIDLGLARSGGTTVWQAGWGYAFGQHVQAGASYERVYLSSTDITMMRTAFTPIEGSYSTDIRDTASTVFRGNGFRGGVLFPFKKLTIGFSGEYIFSGDLETFAVGAHYVDSIAKWERTPFHLPPSFSAGASYRPTPQWIAAGSFGVTMWRDYYSSVKLGLPVDNALTFSAGGQYIPAPTCWSRATGRSCSTARGSGIRSSRSQRRLKRR